jgi:hypothetical protein
VIPGDPRAGGAQLLLRAAPAVDDRRIVSRYTDLFVARTIGGS